MASMVIEDNDEDEGCEFRRLHVTITSDVDELEGDDEEEEEREEVLVEEDEDHMTQQEKRVHEDGRVEQRVSMTLSSSPPPPPTTTKNIPEHKTKRNASKDHRPYRCSQCDLCFKFRSRLTGHLRTHSDERPFQCKKCKYTFKRENHWKRHCQKGCQDRRFTKHDPSCKKCKPFIKHYPCPRCKKVLSWSFSLKRHLKTVHKKNDY